MISLVKEGLTFESVESKKNFSKFDPKQKQTKVGHSVTDEIINGNSKNIGCIIKKAEVLAFKRKSRVVNDFAKKKFIRTTS